MSNVFAKIILASDGAQVVFYKDNGDDGEPAITQVTEAQGVTAKVTAGFEDSDEGATHRDEAFDDLSIEHADNLRTLVRASMDGGAQ